MDMAFSWLFIGVLFEIALILFLLFRLIDRPAILRLFIASMAVMMLLMTLLGLAVTLGEKRALNATLNEHLGMAAAVVVLGIIVFGLARMKEWPYADTARGRAAREHDRANPRPRRSLFFDTVGCLLSGAVALVLLVIAIAAGIALAG